MQEVSSQEKMSSERILAAILIASLALLGLLCNLGCAILMLRLRVFRTSFGVLSVCETLSNSGVLFTFLVWAAPLTITYLPPELEFLNRYIGQTAIFFQTIAHHAVLCISINRFFAITFPSFYRRRLGVRTTLWVVAVVVVASFIYACVYFYEDCYFRYEPREYYWEFADSPCGHAIAFYIDLSYCVGLMSVAIMFELITFMKLKLMTKTATSQGVSTVTNVGNKKQKQDIKFFVQTCSISVSFCFVFFCFHMISPLAETRFEVFMTTTFIWGLGHSGPGIIYMLFNREIRKRLLNPLKSTYTDSRNPKTTAYPATTTIRRNYMTSVAN